MAGNTSQPIEEFQERQELEVVTSVSVDPASGALIVKKCKLRVSAGGTIRILRNSEKTEAIDL